MNIHVEKKYFKTGCFVVMTVDSELEKIVPKARRIKNILFSNQIKRSFPEKDIFRQI